MESIKKNMKDLSNCTKNELIKIAKKYKITGYSKYNKDKLLEYLLDKIDSINITTSDSKLTEYCSSAVFLYGVISQEMLLTIYNTYEEHMPVQLQIDRWVKESEKDFSNFFYQDGYFIKNSLQENNLWKTVLELHSKYDFYIPEKREEFLSFGQKQNNVPGKIYNELRAYLRTDKRLPEHYINAICQLIYEMVGANHPPVNILSKLVDIKFGYNHPFRSHRDVQTLNLHINKILQNSRLIKYRGHTALEVGAVTKEAIIGTLKRFYPNDKCPCGSGEKYKICCGKV